MNRNYPLNCWYVAATSDEIGDAPVARRLLDTDVVLYRTRSGQVIAMEDRCLHRAYPLSAGRRDADRLVCGYHGLVYDPDGSCVSVPSQDNVPQGAQVRTFVVREEAPLVWIWLGLPGAANLRTPPRTPWLSESGWAHTHESRRVEANYLLLHEHYLDLTNVFVMHPEAVPPGIEALPPLDEVEVSELSVSYTRTLPSAPLAGWEAESTGLDPDAAYSRREQGTFVSPALHVQSYTIGDAERAREVRRIHAFTPESMETTHTITAIARDFAIDRDDVGAGLQEMFHDMGARDAHVLETVQTRRSANPARREVNIKADRAALRARRVAQAMVADEAGDR